MTGCERGGYGVFSVKRTTTKERRVAAIPGAHQSETMKQIAEAWDQAKAQFDALRTQVEKAGELANLKLQSAVLERDEDRALRDFGEAVWAAVQKGTLKLPPTLTNATKAMQELQKRKDAQAADIADMLKEGDEVADRLKKAQKPKLPTKSR